MKRLIICFFQLTILMAALLPKTFTQNNNYEFKTSEEIFREQVLFEMGTSMLLIGRFEEAEQFFSELQKLGNQSMEVLNNHGISLIKQGLMHLPEKDVEEIFKYIFPFEINYIRARGPSEFDLGQWNDIGNLFYEAKRIFEKCIDLHSDQPSAYLNAAAAHIMIERWKENFMNIMIKRLGGWTGNIFNNDKNEQINYTPAFDYLNKALELAKTNQMLTTQGHVYILEGILYDYLGDHRNRDQMFEWAIQNAQATVQKIATLNKRIADGYGHTVEFAAVFAGSEHEHGQKPENIGDILLSGMWRYELMELKNGSRMIYEINPSLDGQIFHKSYHHSDLFFYTKTVNSGNVTFIFQKTRPSYEGKSTLGIQQGIHEVLVRKRYGKPYRVHAASNGKYLYYSYPKQPDIIFLIDGNGNVQNWLLIETKMF